MNDDMQSPKEELCTNSDHIEEKESAESRKAKIINSLLNEEEGETDLRNYRWRDLLIIDGQWVRRQIVLILLIVGGIIFYITNRYQAQKDIIELVQLQNELKDMKFRVLTRSSELTLKTRQSELEKQLKNFGDSTLQVTNEAPFIIKKKD
ncbi:MAG: FtsL-like putative cell division protein [Bacteroidaceae bacterium]|nr:FtsL-like putative cell division protein [Bacteroidaceae bacterium]